MLASLGSYASAPRCSADKTYLQKIRFIDILDCYSLFTDCRRKCFKSDRTAVIKTTIASSILLSLRSRPSSSISSLSSAVLAVSSVMTPFDITCAKSRTRFKSRFAIRGVPLERDAISSAPSCSIFIPRIPALLSTICASSSGV